MNRRELRHLYLGADGLPTTMDNDVKLYEVLDKYIQEKNGECAYDTIVQGGIKLYIWNVSEKLFRDVMLKQIEYEIHKAKRFMKVDDGTMVVGEGEIRWVEIVIA